ncbi:MAG: SIR2 family protein [Zoogloea sp.]|nr:SIR2 family protein [Zoogloea sp.]
MKKSDVHKDSYAKLLSRLPSTSTIEDILTHLRSLLEVVRDGNIDGLDKTSLASLDAEICRITTTKLGLICLNNQLHITDWRHGWAESIELILSRSSHQIMDLLVEQAFEAYKIPYFDGFIGSWQAFFDLASMENEELPSRWGRLWKVHGSVNWGERRVTRLYAAILFQPLLLVKGK